MKAIPGIVPSPSQQHNQGGRLINLPIATGGTVRVNSQGTKFYLYIATAPVNIRPDGGDFVTYQQGTGLDAGDVKFSIIEINNPNSVPVVISLFVGFSGFIDNRLIIANVLQPNIAYPTCPTVNSLTQINIKDLSGGGFADINGNKWLAIQRVCILVFNADSGVTLLLQKSGASTASGVSVGIIYPVTPVRFDFSGDFTISVGGGTINAIVSEIYMAIAAE